MAYIDDDWYGSEAMENVSLYGLDCIYDSRNYSRPWDYRGSYDDYEDDGLCYDPYEEGYDEDDYEEDYEDD